MKVEIAKWSKREGWWLVMWVKNNYFGEISSGSEEGSYSRLIDVCITQL
jgi:hypothetical protein